MHFTLRSVIHFELFFCEGYKIFVLIFNLKNSCECSAVLAPVVEETVFSPLYCLCSFVKDQLWVIYVSLFLGFLSVLLLYLFILSIVPHCLGYGSFIVSIELSIISLPALFFNLVLAILDFYIFIYLFIACLCELQN